MHDETGFASLWTTTQDGLRLHARDYAPRVESPRRPMLCLPGLTRNGADFHEIALHIAREVPLPRRVIAMDMRGRGRSDRDSNPANYDVRVEMQDVLDALAAWGLPEVIVLGTSRGGLISFAMAAARPSVLRGVILNDIGPVIEPQGLLRIKSYVGKLPPPRSLEEGVAILKGLSGGQFTRASEADWLRYARRTFRETERGLIADYDPALMQGLAAIDLEQPIPDLWPYFEALAGIPVLAIRGETSDLLTAETHRAMAARHPACTLHSVPGEGHAPLLADAPTQHAIARFLDGVNDGA